ncbi:MAG: group 1 glycosyl transferase [Candidatus Omnitrophica bacterium CG11_big_fil_rev_8_21_14_0_20_63_9]|nr:MAG: group 1 glycosyl transferase [Candidatus Omnitrophica bacterium CG11_big_fil_rev_8_21_14_0_20_63_9]
MRVLFLIPYPPEGASGRYRVLQYLPWLEREGISYQVRPFMSPKLYRTLYQPGRLPQKVAMVSAAILKRFVDSIRSARADVVVIHREALPLGTALLERVAARLCPAMIFDFDDAIYLNQTSAPNAWTRRFKNARKTDTLIRLSAHIIAGNRVLEGYARQFNPHVTVIPTPVDTARYECRPAPQNGKRLVIGWIGSHTTAAYLGALQEPLAAILERYPQVELRVVGAGNVPLRLPRLQLIRWELDREVDALHQFDIGVMPMPDDEWARGKCGFKALLYMSAGIPVVASPVGINSEIVREGVNGFLATTHAQWTDVLSRLIDDRLLRQQMGQAGRAIVEQQYSVTVNAPRFLRVLRDVHERERA